MTPSRNAWVSMIPFIPFIPFIFDMILSHDPS
jgi:hypothetical protein